MTPQRYISERLAANVPLTHIVGELADITATSERTVWRWIKGTGVPSDSALKLLRVWGQLPSDLRAKIM